MKSYRALVLVGVALAFCSGIYATTIHVPADQPTIPSSSAAIRRMNQMPLPFTKNMGQWDEWLSSWASAGFWSLACKSALATRGPDGICLGGQNG